MASIDATRSRGEQATPRLASLRSASGLTLEQLAAILGVDVEMMKSWEAGRVEIPFVVAQRLASRLGVRVDYLLHTELSDEDEMILLVAGLPPDDRDTLAECFAAVGEALAAVPHDRRSGLVRDLCAVRERLGFYFEEASHA